MSDINISQLIEQLQKLNSSNIIPSGETPAPPPTINQNNQNLRPPNRNNNNNNNRRNRNFQPRFQRNFRNQNTNPSVQNQPGPSQPNLLVNLNNNVGKPSLLNTTHYCQTNEAANATLNTFGIKHAVNNLHKIVGALQYFSSTHQTWDEFVKAQKLTKVQTKLLTHIQAFAKESNTNVNPVPSTSATTAFTPTTTGSFHL